MAPKQATLGYVKPSQTTLGKFFSNPHGAKPAASQQSKLSFATKAETKKENVKKEDGTSSAPEKLEKEQEPAKNVKIEKVEDEDMQDGEDTEHVKVEADPEPTANADNIPANSPQTSPKPLGRKRGNEDENESENSEEEPPSKKRRTKVVAEEKSKKAKPSKAASSDKPAAKVSTTEIKDLPKKVGRKSVAFDKSTSDSKSTGKIDRKATPKKPSSAVDQEEDESVDSPLAMASATSKIDLKESAEESELEDDEPADSEDEKPEIAAKAREKVQSTLTGKAKDPFPDWKPGEAVPYGALCTTFHKIEMTTKRLEIQAHCSLFLRQVLRLTPKELLPTIQLMINKLAADYSGIELGIGESLIMKAIGETTGRTLAIIKADQNEIGDLGLVAAKSRSNQPTMFKPKPLTVRGVHEGLVAIATIEGQGAQGRKVAGIKKLLSSADAHLAGKGAKGVDITKDKGGPSESKYLIRALEGKMRLGLAEKTVLISLASAMVTHELEKKNSKLTTDELAKGESILKTVYSELPSYEVVIPAMLEHGIFHLQENCKLQPGVPLKPMLAKPTKSITEVLDRFEGKDFSCEYKYDGERAQIHFVAHDSDEQFATAAPKAGKNKQGISNIFSRNSEDLSKKYPDILEKLPTWVKEGTKSFVLDCETVAWDVDQKKVLPFQQLMTRKKKDVKVEDIKVKVCVFAFDLIFLNGEALVKRSFRERRELLKTAFTEVEGEFAFAKYGNTNELDEIQTLLDESVKASCEGLMVKMLDGPESHYEPSRRSQNWLKVKKDYLAGIGDSLDLVVIGAYYGKGKRTSVYGAFLLACYNPGSERYETVCNIGTGFSEAVLEELHAQLSPIIIDKPKPYYSHSAVNKDQPDVWFQDLFVWEVLCADLTLSPRYKAAANQMEGGKGVSLRFPRFLKIRDDKKASEATTSRAVAEMYRKQESVSKTKGPSVDDDFEY